MMITVEWFLSSGNSKSITGRGSAAVLLLEGIVNHGHSPSNGREIFNAGSSILSILNTQLVHGLDQLKHYLPKDLGEWVKEGNKALKQDQEEVPSTDE